MTSSHPTDPEAELWHHEIRSRVGPLTIVAGADALVGLYHAGHRPAPDQVLLGESIAEKHLRERGVPPASGVHAAAPAGRTVDLLRQAALELGEYFAGSRYAFDTPIELHGTDFQRRVWAELSLIPYGETRSYRDIATRLGNPRMGRAIGAAVRSNPVSIIVPGHRVVSSSGAVIGYATGTAAKLALLELEAGPGGDSDPAPVRAVQR